MTNYIIDPIYFYLADVADLARSIFLTASLLIIFLTVMLCVVWAGNNAVDISNMDDDEKITFKKFKKFIIIGLIFLLVGTAVPSKRTCIEMMITSKLTYENVSETREEVYEIIDYVVDKFDTSNEN